MCANASAYAFWQSRSIREELTVTMLNLLREIAHEASENRRLSRLSTHRRGAQILAPILAPPSMRFDSAESVDAVNWLEQRLSQADRDLLAAMCACVSDATTVASFDAAEVARLLFPTVESHRATSVLNLFSGGASASTIKLMAVERERQVRAMMESEAVTPMLEPKPMSLWMHNLLHNNDAQTKATLTLYATVNVAVRTFVEDSSDSSEYAHNKEAQLYRSLISAHPYLLDALVACSEEEAQRFSAVVKWIEWARQTYGDRGSISRFVVRLDRGALAYFLAEHANAQARRSLATLMRQMFSALRHDTSSRTAHGRCFIGRFKPFVHIDPIVADRCHSCFDRYPHLSRLILAGLCSSLSSNLLCL